MAAERLTPATLIDAIVETFAGSDAGRAALAAAGRKHAALLLPENVRQELIEGLDQLKTKLVDLPRQARRSGGREKT